MNMFALLAALLFFTLPAVADEATAEQKLPPSLKVGVKHAPPFAIKQTTGHWGGISVDLWNQMATELGWNYQFEERDLAGLLTGVESGDLDAAVGALTVTAEREQKMDFSHPFYTSGLSIAVPTQPVSVWLGVVKAFFTWEFLSVVAGLTGLLLIVGLLVWLFEHKRNKQFGGPLAHGVGSGLWWSAVTMTTVGYGDKAPVTFGGRVVALVWMFASIVVISSFTAAIASSLTVRHLSSGIAGPQDLEGIRTGSVVGSSSEAYLQGRYIEHIPFSSVNDGLDALVSGEIGAFVYDRPLLQYLVKTRYQGQVDVLPAIFGRQDYAVGLVQQSDLKERIDQQLLRQIESPGWQELLRRYLGSELDS